MIQQLSLPEETIFSQEDWHEKLTMATAEVTNVRVALRCRPLSKKELSEADVSVFRKEGETLAKLDMDVEGESEREFAFDFVYDDKSTQEEVFKDVGLPVVEAALDGFNSTVFAYGQTGSGKSWSMTGDAKSDDDKGLIPRINEALFAKIEKVTSEEPSRHFLVQVSYFEIYNEVLYDLLDPRPRKDKERAGGLQIKEHPVLGIHVPGLQRLVATDAKKVFALMELGAKNRTVGSTAMNAESSRSHSICLLNVHQKDDKDESRNVYAKLNLVDLAGSERADRTGATGTRLKEGSNINKSLSTLGSVINGLVERGRAANSKKKVFIPYRDSKLTRVLQESLGGNSLCTMLATLSPAKLNAKETLSTLRYAARAKTIKVSVTKNEEASQISMLNEEVAKLKRLLEEQQQQASSNNSGSSNNADVVDMSAVKLAEEKLAQQIAETEALTRQTWEEKQRASKQYEDEIAKMKKAHKDATRKADAERRRRFQLLREKADVELSVKELGLPAKWGDAARHVRTLEARAKERRAHVGVFRDALAGDLATLKYCDEKQGDASALALVRRGAAEAVEARVCLLVKELAKLEAEELGLANAADNLVSDVESSLEAMTPETTEANALRKRERMKLVFDQCATRRDALAKDASLAKASVIKDDTGDHSDVFSMAKDIATEVKGILETTKDNHVPEDLRRKLAASKTTLEGLATTAVDAAISLRQAIAAAGTSHADAKDMKTTLVATRASSGDPKKAAVVVGKQTAKNINIGWQPDAKDENPSLTFDFDELRLVASVQTQPGVVVVGNSQEKESDRKVDGSDRHLTVTALTKIISWSALRLKPEKAEKLLARPPVRFLVDVITALDAASAPGWLPANEIASLSARLTADQEDAKEGRRAFFASVAASLVDAPGVAGMVTRTDDDGGLDVAGFASHPDSILAGQGPEGTNALLQALVIAGLQQNTTAWTTLPKEIVVDLETEAGAQWTKRIALDKDGAVLPSDVPLASRCRVSPVDFEWRTGDQTHKKRPDDHFAPACRVALQVVDPSDKASAEGGNKAMTEIDLLEANQALATDLGAMQEAMVAGIAAIVAATRHAAQAAARAQKAAADAERGKAEELFEEVRTLREANGRCERLLKEKDEALAAATAELEDAKYAAQAAEEHRLSAEESKEAAVAKTEEYMRALETADSDHTSRVETLTATVRNGDAQRQRDLDDTKAALQEAKERAADLEETARQRLERIEAAEAAAELATAQLKVLQEDKAKAETQRRASELKLAEAECKALEAGARLEAQHKVNEGNDKSAEVAELSAALEAAKASAESARRALSQQAAEAQTELATEREQLALSRAEAAEAKRGLTSITERVERLTAQKAESDATLTGLRADLAAAREEALRTEATKAKAEEHDKEKVCVLETKVREATDRVISVTMAKDKADQKVKTLEEKLKTTTETFEKSLKEVREEVDAERTKTSTAEKLLRQVRAEAALAAETAAEERALFERSKLEQQTAAYELESDLDAAKAQVEVIDRDLESAQEATARAEAALEEAIASRDEALKARDEGELALQVAEEERDAARDKEELLSNEMESLREDLDHGSEAYVNLSNRLADVSDDLTDTRERLEEYVEKDQLRAREFLQANANVESEALQQAAQASKEARRAYDEAQRATHEADNLRKALKAARERLGDHFARAGVPLDLPKGRLQDDSSVALADTIATIVSAAIDRDSNLARRLSVAERPPEVVETIVDGTHHHEKNNADDYDDDFE